MEGMHSAFDLSWLGRSSSKDQHNPQHQRPAAASPTSPDGRLSRSQSASGSYFAGNSQPQPPPPPRARSTSPTETSEKPGATATQPDNTEWVGSGSPASGRPQNASQPASLSKSSRRLPILLSRTNSSEKQSATSATSEPSALPASKTPPRRAGFFSNISAKFSSPANPNAASPAPSGSGTAVSNTTATATEPDTPTKANGDKPSTGTSAAESLHPYVPQIPKSSTGSGGSFFSSALRRLSSGQAGASKPISYQGVVSPRRVLNIDPNRPRCLVPELDTKKLRRVAFCVDVEIAAAPKYKDDDTSKGSKEKKKKDRKMKDRSEGEALKNPKAVEEQKEADGVIKATGEKVGTDAEPAPADTTAEKESSGKRSDKKKEKKKKSEEERKDRKEKRRKMAEEYGALPLEIHREMSNESVASTSSNENTTVAPAPRPRNRPTTDPLRIYRRCCQLRETPILKRITEQLAAASKSSVEDPGTIAVLDLTGSRLQPADVVTLGDWLAVVPVRRLLLEDADLTDEGIRVVLAGLLAAKAPEMSWSQPPHNQTFEERSGHVEKLTLKNNPRMTAIGWKHVALFIYMCKSLKTLDVSMNRFPVPRPHVVHQQQQPQQQQQQQQRQQSPPPQHHHFFHHRTGSNVSTASSSSKPPAAVADIFAKALSERRGGDRLEELTMAKCGLDAETIRKITGAVTMSGLKRLGLAENNVDDEALGYILLYLKSGVCQGLDLGGNNFRDRCGTLAEAIASMKDSTFWGLSLADCNLNPDSLNALIPALSTLRNFKFLDLSQNRQLFAGGQTILASLRKYLPRFQALRRIHLADVSLSPAQAIRLAEVLPEVPHLAHLNILDNPALTALANATTETDQEEACALYASLMAAVRVSESIICIDVDVPSPENSPIVQALAKQVVAYCLRNMDRWTAGEGASAPILEHDLVDAGGPTAAGPHQQIDIPDVLLHLVGHDDGSAKTAENEPPPPGQDYMLGGTGVVKALSYVLSEKGGDWRRSSLSSRPGSGPATPLASAVASPREEGPLSPRPSLSVLNEESQRSRAKEMSKNLLTTARSVQARLRPALLREATTGDEAAYKRLLFLENTLQGIIRRFEDEYPECRLENTSEPPIPVSVSFLQPPHPAPADITSPKGPTPDVPSSTTDRSAVEDHVSDEDDDPEDRPTLRSRHNSDVSLASRALSLEEGQMHRLNQHMHRDILGYAASTSPVASSVPPSGDCAVEEDDAALTPTNAATAAAARAPSPCSSVSAATGGTGTSESLLDAAARNAHHSGTLAATEAAAQQCEQEQPAVPCAPKHEDQFLAALRQKLHALPSSKLRDYVLAHGWEGALAAVGEDVEELRRLRELARTTEEKGEEWGRWVQSVGKGQGRKHDSGSGLPAEEK